MDLIERFAETLNGEEVHMLTYVRSFVDWHVSRGVDFTPRGVDDVDLRTYALTLKMNGVNHRSQHKHFAALRRFYEWAEAAGLLDYNPFDEFNVERPSLPREQIRRRKETFTGTAEQREIARLHAMNLLAEQLNRSADVETMLRGALETLVSLMDLKTAWVFLIPTSGSLLLPKVVLASAGYELAAACGLPPGLEREDRHYLRKPEPCHCQAVMKAGQLQRAVNIVECTRLVESARAGGDNEELQFHASVPLIASGAPLGIMNVATRDWQFLTSADLQLLSTIGLQISVALERARLYDIAEAQRLRLEQELQLARQVQESLLPDRLPEIPGFGLAAEWLSASVMSGDFYDVFPLPDGRWGIVVADVSDKGAPAALYMSMTHSLIRASAGSNQSPAAALEEVNRRLSARSSSAMFVTAFYAILDAGSRMLTYANAGHIPPLVRRRAAQHVEQLTRTGMALGITEELKIAEAAMVLEPGDVLVMYTDGMLDALNAQGEDYGLRRFSASLMEAPVSEAGPLLEHLTGAWSDFTGGVPAFDDMTLMALSCGEGRTASGGRD